MLDGAVFDTQGLPPYPPRHNAWQYPPPPVKRRWLWFALAVSTFAAAAAVALTTTIVVLEMRDAPGLIDDKTLTALIRDSCDDMAAAVESLPLGGSPSQQARTISEQNLAVSAMLSQITVGHRELVASDQPAELWIRDWARLIAARERYRVDLLRGENARFAVPKTPSGEPISERMNDVWLGDMVCTVPVTLLYPGAEILSHSSVQIGWVTELSSTGSVSRSNP